MHARRAARARVGRTLGAAVRPAVVPAGRTVRAAVERALGPGAAVRAAVRATVGTTVLHAGGAGRTAVGRALATGSGRHHVVIVQRHQRILLVESGHGPRRPAPTLELPWWGHN